MRRLSLLLLLAGTAHAEPVDWWTLDRNLTVELQDRDLDAWATQLANAPLPTDPHELTHHFDLFVRAGRLEDAERSFRALAEINPSAPQAKDMAMFLLERQSWTLSRELMETFPHAHPGWAYVMVRAWEADPDTIDAWLAARAEDDPAEDFWLMERLRFRRDQRTEASLIAELEQGVRRTPTDVDRALTYLKAVKATDPNQYNPSWLSKAVRPDSAHDAWRLGEELARVRPAAAVSVLRDALERPWTDADQQTMDRWMRMNTAMMLPQDPSWEATFRDGVKGALLVALQGAGQVEEAQALLEEITAGGGVSMGLSQLAGQVQAASGTQVVQGQILDQEPTRTDDISYWQERAGYFTGRGEHAQAVFAYEKATALAAGEPIGPGGVRGRHSQILRAYANYLERHDHAERAASLLHTYLALADPAGGHAEQLVNGLTTLERDNTRFLAHDDPVLWAFLDAQSPWDYAEERLLWRLAKNALNGPERDGVWERAAELCGDDASRLRVLGWVQTRTEAHARAVPHLVRAVQLSEGDDREGAAFTLFEAHLKLGDWAEAEALWTEVRGRLTPREQPEWLSRVALGAAVAGEPDHALRVWKQRANLDRSDLRGLEELAGMKSRLASFYEDLARAHPDSEALGNAVDLLR